MTMHFPACNSKLKKPHQINDTANTFRVGLFKHLPNLPTAQLSLRCRIAVEKH